MKKHQAVVPMPHGWLLKCSGVAWDWTLTSIFNTCLALKQVSRSEFKISIQTHLCPQGLPAKSAKQNGGSWKLISLASSFSAWFAFEMLVPAELFLVMRLADDVLTKDVSHLRNKICAYCCGFPCTPYSFLHTGTSLLQDANCQQLFQIVRNCKRMLPAVSGLHINFLQVLFSDMPWQQCSLKHVKGFIGIETKTCIWDHIVGECDRILESLWEGLEISSKESSTASW